MGIEKYTEVVKKLKVLVIGDIIIDKYTYCLIQGLMSKDTAYSVRFQEEEQFGGSIAIAGHLKDFADNITLCAVMGNESNYKQMFDQELSKMMKLELVESETFPTIVKHRFLQKNTKREEYKKYLLLTIYRNQQN